MGKYDALFADDGTDDVPPAFLDRDAAKGAAAAKADGGKYAALFDEPAAPAAPDRIGKAAADYSENVQGLKDLAPVAAAPTTADAAYAGLRRGASAGFGDEVEGAGLAARDLLARRTGLSGLGDSYRAHRDFARARDAAAEHASPLAATIGEAAGGIVPSLLTDGATEALGAGQLAPVAQAAVKGAAFGGVAGAGNSEADLTRGEVAPFLSDVGTGAATNAALSGAVHSVVGGAPERVDRRVLSGISRGEAGGAAKDSIYRKVIARAGEGGENLFDAVGDDPQLQRALAVRAKSNPGAVEKLVGRRLDQLNAKTTPFYDAIDAAPDPRFANPAKAPPNGGIDIGAMANRFEQSAKDALDSGHTALADVYTKARARLIASYGTDGALIPGTKLPARALRNYANEIGEGVFTGSESPTFKAKAQQQLYRDVVGTIEAEGAKVGVDTGELRRLNQKISTLIPVRQALADRAAKAAAGRTSLANVMTSSALIGGGGAAHGIEGMAAGAAADAARRAALPAGRMADYQLARLVQAARNGSTAAQVASLAAEMGLRSVAEQIARNGLGALSGTNVQDSAPPGP